MLRGFFVLEGMPRIVRHVQNTWRLEQITPERTRVFSQIQLRTRYGAAGALFARVVMKPRLTGFMKTALEDFRSFVEDSDAARSEPPPGPSSRARRLTHA